VIRPLVPRFQPHSDRAGDPAASAPVSCRVAIGLVIRRFCHGFLPHTNGRGAEHGGVAMATYLGVLLSVGEVPVRATGAMVRDSHHGDR
jgi:hypothetical protein